VLRHIIALLRWGNSALRLRAAIRLIAVAYPMGNIMIAEHWASGTRLAPLAPGDGGDALSPCAHSATRA
jgi:hypothetical protein